MSGPYCEVTLWVRGNGASNAPIRRPLGVEDLQIGSAKEKTNYKEIVVSQRHFVFQKCHRDRSENELRYKR
jgi:hypothetical protein